MKLVTDPKILEQLNAPDDENPGKLVTDPEILAQLNAPDDENLGKLVTDPELLAKLNDGMPKTDLSPQWAQNLANSWPVQFILGAGDANQNFLANLVNLSGSHVPLAHNGDGFSYGAGRVGGEIGNFFLPMGLTTKALKAAKGLPLLGDAAAKIMGEGFLPTMGRGALAGSQYGAVMNPENRLKGAAFEGAGGALGGAIGESLSHLLPSRFLASRTSLSPKELLNNVNVARGTLTPMGDIIESPDVKHLLENVLSKIPGSGVYSTMQRNAMGLRKIGEDLLKNISEGAGESNFKESIASALKKSYKKAQNQKRNLYNNVDKLAKDQKIEVGRNNFSSEASNILQDVKQSPELLREMSKKLLNDLKFYSKSNQSNNFKLTNIFRGKLGEKASKAFDEGNLHESDIYQRLKDAITNDIEDVIPKNSDNPLRQKYDKAQSFYRENIAPFEDRDVSKYARLGGDSDEILSTFIKKGKNDRGNLLSKLMDKIPEQDQSAVKAAYFDPAVQEEKFSPLEFRNLFKNLGKNQKNVLFKNPDERNLLEYYSKLIGMNTESLTGMFNPKTGWREIAGLTGLHGISGGAGYTIDGTPGLLAGLAMPSILAKILAKKLTSPEIREKLVKKIIDVQKGEKSSSELIGSSLGSSLAQKYSEVF